MTRGTTWSAYENLLLVDLRDEQKLTWAAIAVRLPRHSQSTCQQHYYGLKPRKAAATACAGVPQQAANAAPPSARTMTTARLVVDAELRGRIALQGITAGLLGDPMPGRSALDRKRAGEASR